MSVFFVVREEFLAPGCQKLFFGCCAIGVDFGFGHIHVQTPILGWSIAVVETVLDVGDVLTFDQDVVDVSVVASTGVCPGGEGGGGTVARKWLKRELR